MTRKFVGIRFSIPLPPFEKTAKITTKEKRDEWIRNRVNIFNKITYPSLSLHEDITTFIFMGGEDQWALDFMSFVGDERFVPIFSHEFNINTMFMREVDRAVYDEEKVILSRLDSDDAIHRDYFEHMDYTIFLNRYIIQPRGIMWDEKRCTQSFNKRSQFISCFTNKKMSPFAFPHNDVLNHPHRTLNKKIPMWLTYVHGGNLANMMPTNISEEPGMEMYSPDLSDFGIQV